MEEKITLDGFFVVNAYIDFRRPDSRTPFKDWVRFVEEAFEATVTGPTEIQFPDEESKTLFILMFKRPSPEQNH